MHKLTKVVKTLLIGMLMLLGTGLMISCATKPLVILGESRTVHLGQNEPAPFDGWLLTDDALAKLLELAELGKASRK